MLALGLSLRFSASHFGQAGSPQRQDLALQESLFLSGSERAAEAGLPVCACLRAEPSLLWSPRLVTEMPTLRLSAVMAGPLQASLYAWIQLEVYTAHS